VKIERRNSKNETRKTESSKDSKDENRKAKGSDERGCDGAFGKSLVTASEKQIAVTRAKGYTSRLSAAGFFLRARLGLLFRRGLFLLLCRFLRLLGLGGLFSLWLRRSFRRSATGRGASRRGAFLFFVVGLHFDLDYLFGGLFVFITAELALFFFLFFKAGELVVFFLFMELGVKHVSSAG